MYERLLPDGQSVALPDTGDLEADLKLVMRTTAQEFADPSFDKLIRALNTEIANDAALAAEYREKLAQPLEEAKKARLRSAQEAGQLDADADLDGGLRPPLPAVAAPQRSADRRIRRLTCRRDLQSFRPLNRRGSTPAE